MKKIYFIIVLTIFYLLAGCASVTPTSLPLESTQYDTEAKKFVSVPDKAVLYIYRDQFTGSIWQIPVFINGKFIGKTGGYTFFRIEIEPGSYTIQSNAENTSKLQLNVEAGKIYYVRHKTKTGFKEIRADLVLVDEKTGKDGVIQSRMLKHGY